MVLLEVLIVAVLLNNMLLPLIAIAVRVVLQVTPLLWKFLVGVVQQQIVLHITVNTQKRKIHIS